MSDVVIASVGARTPVGLDARQTGFLLRAGYPAMAEAPLANEAGEAITMAFVPTIDGRSTGAERLAALAQSPLEEAISPIRDLAAEVYIALDEGVEDAKRAGDLLGAMALRLMPSARVSVEPRGEAALGHWLSSAARSLSTRVTDAVILGGAHSDYDPRAIAALEASGRLFSRERLDARIPGESAAFVVLMREGDAARRGLSPSARLVGFGVGRERATPSNDVPAYEALGLSAAVRRAIEPLATSEQKIGWLLSDVTFEMRRQLEWQSVFLRVQSALGNPYHGDAPAQRIGYLGASALPLFVTMGAVAWAHGYAPSPLLLATAGNDGGDRAAIVLEKAR